MAYENSLCEFFIQVIGARSRFGARFNTTEMLDRISPPFSISTKSTEGKILDQAKVELRWKCMTQNGACLELSIFKSKTKTGGNQTVYLK